LSLAFAVLGYNRCVVVSAPLVVAVLVGIIVAVAAAIALVVWRGRRAAPRRRARPSGRLRHPVVLAHGLLGFDKIAIGGREHSYFKGVTGHLMRVGAEVHRPRVPSAASIALRAEELARLVRMIPAKKVNIIAHSMGGLDVRYAISKLGLADRVASLITIGTPHLGTPVADLGARLSELLRLKSLLGRIVDVDAFYDLTTERMERFNRDVADAPGVIYGSVIARVERARAHPLLWATHVYLSERTGDNDGIVPVASQRWGEVWKEIDADHWGQIGWSNGFDALALYEDLLRELRARGF
jgi:triacylglycerol lipase